MRSSKVLLISSIICLQFSYTVTQCESVPHTFSYTTTSVCDGVSCYNRTIDGCFEEQGIKKVYVLSPVKQIKRGAFKNMENLDFISLYNVSVVDIEPKAFINLTNLREFMILHNNLSVIYTSVFSKMSTSIINLSSNRITHIEDYAFADMPNLFSLSLNNNQLKRIEENWFLCSTNIKYLHFSDNELTTLDMDVFRPLTKLRALHLQYNNIHRIDNTLWMTMEIMDLYLSGNRLTDVTFLWGATVRYLYLGMNKISVGDELLRALKNTKIGTIYLEPNPWLCTCLNRMETAMRRNNVEVGRPKDDTSVEWGNEDVPVCVEFKNKIRLCDGVSGEDEQEGRREYFSNYKYIDTFHRLKNH